MLCDNCGKREAEYYDILFDKEMNKVKENYCLPCAREKSFDLSRLGKVGDEEE